MSVRQKAIGVAWGISSSAFTYTGAATVLKAKGVSQSFRKQSDVVEVKDQNGEVNGLVFFNQSKELTLRVYPSDTTIALAKTAAGTMGMELGDKFAVTDADDPDIAGTTYVVTALGKERVQDNIVFFDITVKEFANDVTADTA